MKRRHIAILSAVLLLLTSASMVRASSDEGEDDSETRMTKAKVVEVTEYRISVIARTGVEHVIAINDSNTRVLVDGKPVALKNVRKGDVVTVELDEDSPLKFAREIRIDRKSDSELAASP